MNTHTIIELKRSTFLIAQHFIPQTLAALNANYTNANINSVLFMPHAPRTEAHQGVMAFIFTNAAPSPADIMALEQRLLADFRAKDIETRARAVTVKPDPKGGAWVCFVLVELIIELMNKPTLAAPRLDHRSRLTN